MMCGELCCFYLIGMFSANGIWTRKQRFTPVLTA